MPFMNILLINKYGNEINVLHHKKEAVKQLMYMHRIVLNSKGRRSNFCLAMGKMEWTKAEKAASRK